MEHREEGVVCVGGMFFSNLSQQLSLSTGVDPSFNISLCLFDQPATNKDRIRFLTCNCGAVKFLV